MKEIRLMTPGVLAEMLGLSLTKTLYLLRTRRWIRPVARAGILRLYDSSALVMLESEIKRGKRKV